MSDAGPAGAAPGVIGEPFRRRRLERIGGIGIGDVVEAMAALAVAAVVAVGCSGGSGTQTVTSVEVVPRGGDEVEQILAGEDPASTEAVSGGDPAAGGAPAAAPTGDLPAGPQRSALGDRIVSLGPAAGLDDLAVPADGPAPVAIDLPSIGVRNAPIVDVGVEPDGAMEIPGASDVGWYRFGPRPGTSGSSVLAAHIAFDGVDGVFRDLVDVEPGDRFTVRFDDGSRERFVAIGLRQWSKLDIPLEDLFARDGTPRLVLITCGGTFNPQLASYDDNIVVIAVPLDFALGADASAE